ncbi:MAG: MBL fold metallo-hydrolase [Oscillospiraceae bacterium]|nr:MBL fold metallo-hydrolase [Oscillospiraceae bacterium]
MIWDGYMKPFKIFGNLYFIGTAPASTHLIDTTEGLILIDTGYQHSLYLVLNNLWELGFSPYDIKYILHTHGHIDHFGATRALVELTGAKTFLGRPDRDYANGTADLSYARELGMEFKETFEPDVLLEDGDTICLGNTEITCVATPGHTPGAMSYFFDVTDGTETFRAGLHGGMGINTLSAKFLSKYHLPFSLREDFCRSMLRLNGEKVDIFLGNHMQHNRTKTKYQQLLEGNPKAFIDPEEWQKFNLFCIENLEDMVLKEERSDNQPGPKS